MKKVVGYCRVSTREQVSDGISLEAQESAIRAYCVMRGLELVEVVVDAGVSAGEPLASRSGGARVIEMAAMGCGVVAFKLDRLFRDCAECLNAARAWEKTGATLHLLDLGGQSLDTSSAMGRFFLTVMAGAAELERNQVRERTKAAMAHLKSEGVMFGGIPLGLRRTGERDEHGRLKYEKDEHEAEIVARIKTLRSAGCSMRVIAKALSDEGYRPRTGKAWYASTVRSVLVRAA